MAFRAVRHSARALLRTQAMRSSTRGATRLEIILITTFTAVVASVGLWFFSDSAGSSERAAAIVDAEKLLSAAAEWKKQHQTKGCPSFSQLRRDQTVPVGARADDPWGGRYRIACGANEVRVHSAGGDGRFKTEDDISISASWTS